MTKVTILRTDGTAVRLDDKFIELKFDTEGFLIGFTYEQSTYKYLQNIDFNIKDKSKANRQGYYAEVKFQLYMALMHDAGYQSPPINFKPGFLKDFNFSGFEAKAEDEITVEITDFGAPFNYYYKEKQYTFFLENSMGTNVLKKYKRAVFDESAQLLGFKIDISSSVDPQVVDQNLMDKPSGYFYKWNYGSNVDHWQISNTDKATYKKIVTLAAHKTYFIIEDILRKIITSDSLGRIYGNANSGTATNPDPNELDSLEILVFNLLWSWGEFYDPSADSEYIYKHDSVVSIQSASYLKPIYHEFNNYFQSLSQFYLTSFTELEILKTLDDRKKLEKLLYILPVSALKLIPYQLRILSLQRYIVNGSVSEEDEEHMVRLVLSIENFRADNFLDFLLERTNGTDINFEIIYKLLDDARIERYPVLEWFVDEQTNRKYYAYAVYQLWKVSKYNWNYFPTGTVHGTEEINDQSYFRINKKEYNEKNILEFYVPEGSIQSGRFLELKDARKYFTEMQDIAIHITSRMTGLRLSLNGNKLNDQSFSESINLGDFHIYHPMTLTGYQSNFELEFPKESMVPAFLYHYAEEYDELVDFDAGIALAINVGLDIALFFATGGGSILNDLKYLKYVTKLGQAIRGGILPPTELVTIWRAAEGVSQVVELTASTIGSYQGYLATKANDEATRAHHLAIQRWMIGLMFTSIGTTIYARIRAVREADRILKIIENFPAGAHGVPQNIIDLLTTLRGKQVVMAANLEARLDAINVNGIIDDVITKFNQLDNNEKYLFFEDFGKLTENEWIKLNQNASSKIDNWLLLKNNNIIEAKNLEVISSQRLVNGFLRYYDKVNAGDDVRKILESLNVTNRIKFIRDFATQPPEWFNHIKGDPSAISRWANLDNYGKLFAQQKPDIWLYRFDRLYQNVPKWSRMVDTEVIRRFGQEGLDLVTEVEIFALGHISTRSKRQLLKNDILISGIKDKSDNITSSFFTNFSKEEIRAGEYQMYLDNMFPNLKNRIDEVIAFNKKNYRIADVEYLKNTGSYPGAHAEIRALDDLAKKKFGNNLPTNEEFNAWLKNDLLGYNRNIQHGTGQQNIGMHTCADCFHIIDLITFIKP